jgi:hypothetical protein
MQKGIKQPETVRMFRSEMVREELLNILKIIADLSRNNSSTDLSDRNTYEASNRPKDEVEKYLDELVSLGHVEQTLPPSGARPSGVDFMLFHITQKGLEELAGLPR